MSNQTHSDAEQYAAGASAPALMEQEKRFLQALENVQRWDVSPIDQMRFWPAEGKPLRWWLEEG